MALNFADLFEHAADAFGERAAVACGDRQVTYRELEERANRLAHHLAGLGVGPGDHVGLYARNSLEAIETLIAGCKLRAAAVNINYRYVETELQYMFADSDLTALVYDRRLAPVVAAAAPAAPGLAGCVEIDDGTSSAALFSPAVKDACAKALPDAVITEAIGSTETGFAGISFVSAGDPHRGGPTVLAGPDVIVLDDHGGLAGPGQVGRLARGGHVLLGYYKDPERTAAMFAEVNGKRYAVPGDMARVEDDGTVTLLGRGNTCVNTGGEKVFPEEVEGTLKSHPDVFDVLVIGLPDERLGQRVAALVQPRPGAAPDLAALAEHVRGQIAGYKVPRSIWLTEAIRRTVSGKADYGWARRYAADQSQTST